MTKTAYAASYIHDNMPFGITYLTPVLTVQQAWDVAAYHDLQAASAGDAGDRIRAAIRAQGCLSRAGARREPDDGLDQFLRPVEREEMAAAVERGHLNAGDQGAVVLAL